MEKTQAEGFADTLINQDGYTWTNEKHLHILRERFINLVVGTRGYCTPRLDEFVALEFADGSEVLLTKQEWTWIRGW